MQVTITYLLTEQAQRAQMAATGQPVARAHTVTEEIPVELLDSPLARIDETGAISFNLSQPIGVHRDGTLSGSAYGYGTVYPQFSAMPESGLSAIRTRMAEIEAYQAQMRSAAADAATRQAELDRLDAEQREKQKIAADEAASIKAATEAAKAAAIDAFVGQSGDAMLIEQHAARLLCRKTVISLMAGDCLDRYLPAECPDSVVCENSRCPCMDTRQDCVPPDIYAAWKAMGDMPTGTTVEFRKVRKCLSDEDTEGAFKCLSDEDTEGAGPVEYHAIVTIPSGPFQFERRIKLEAA